MTVALLTRIAREKRLVFVPLVVALLVNVVLAVAVVLPLSRRVAGAETRETQAIAALQVAERDRAAQAATLQH
ncbi:MAG: hypothetical protein Q7V01_11595, partial [Vicinamibacterales bacterium]|nr:hypothetical protein [Vicinamibacterales bacterium]